MKTQIKKGDKFLCKLDYSMLDGQLAYRKGDVYTSPATNQLSSILHFDHGQSIIDEEFLEHFELIKENPIQHDDFNEYTKEIIVKDAEIVTVKNDPIVSSVMFQLAQRSILGQQKYGTTLQDNNKDNFLQHLKEELMDAILYIEKLQSND
jgi:hypothetical protein